MLTGFLIVLLERGDVQKLLFRESAIPVIYEAFLGMRPL